MYLIGSLIFENGPAWKVRRRVTLAALHQFGGSRRSLERNINDEALYLCQEFSKQNGQPFDPSNTVSTAMSNIICSISFGRRFSYDDPAFRRVLANLDAVLHCSFVGSVLQTLPFISRIPGLNGIRKALDEIFDFNRDMVREHKTTFNPDYIGM